MTSGGRAGNPTTFPAPSGDSLGTTALAIPRLAESAETYCELGWCVHPLRPRTKLPATAHGWKDATSSCDRIASWWRREPRATIGIATGPSGLLVVDCDGEEGQGAWADLAAENGGHERTRASVTGTSGLHVWFRGDGRGGFVVTPPSVHPNGNRYRWRAQGDPIPSIVLDLPRLLRPQRCQRSGH